MELWTRLNSAYGWILVIYNVKPFVNRKLELI